jgi:hypothetical protein
MGSRSVVSSVVSRVLMAGARLSCGKVGVTGGYWTKTALPGKTHLVISIKTDLGEIPAGIDRLIGDDLPFTIARFLTMQAQSGQGAARAGEKSVFKLRNDWTTQQTKITPATKSSLLSEVYTDTGNRKTGAPDYLPLQDTGGDKVPLAGHKYLAIPTRYLRKYAPGVIPDAMRPKNLLPPGINKGEAVTGSFAIKGSRPRRGLGRDVRKKLGSSEFVAFVQNTKSGTLCIFVRHGGIGFHGGTQDAEPWYTLVPDAHITARFPMEELVQAAVDADAEKNFDRAAAEVLVNNALRSGLRVKF